MLTGRYAAPVAPAAVATTTGEAPPDDATLEKHVVAPRMFKQLVSRGNKEFSSSRQQDASEYLTFFLDVLAKAEHASLRRLDPAVLEASPLGPRATQALFEFHVETRRQCARTGQVWYSPLGRATRAMELEMQIPLHQATNRDAVEAAKNRKKQRLDGGEASSSGTSHLLYTTTHGAALTRVVVVVVVADVLCRCGRRGRQAHRPLRRVRGVVLRRQRGSRVPQPLIGARRRARTGAADGPLGDLPPVPHREGDRCAC